MKILDSLPLERNERLVAAVNTSNTMNGCVLLVTDRGRLFRAVIEGSVADGRALVDRLDIQVRD